MKHRPPMKSYEAVELPEGADPEEVVQNMPVGRVVKVHIYDTHRKKEYAVAGRKYGIGLRFSNKFDDALYVERIF